MHIQLVKASGHPRRRPYRRRVAPAIALVTLLLGACRTGRVADQGSGATASGAVAAMAGTVLDRTNGRGLMGATVHLLPDDSSPNPGSAESAMTLDDGSFVFARVMPGRYYIEVNARGFKPHRSSTRFSAGQLKRNHTVRLTPVAVCPSVIAGRKNPACP